jgi:hypothetical protein
LFLSWRACRQSSHGVGRPASAHKTNVLYTATREKERRCSLGSPRTSACDSSASPSVFSNGSFEHAPSGSPFDWVISPGSAVTIDIAAPPDQDGKRALFIEFGHGRVEFRDVTQLIMPGPGSYQVHGRYHGEVVGRRGLQWRVTCADDKLTRIGESIIFNGLAPSWKDFAFSFTLPDSGCRAQYLRLALNARSASEQFVSGSIWYDELRIVPAEPQ